MKKIALFVMFSCLTMISYAQVDTDFRFGFHVSPTFTWLGNNADNDAIEAGGAQMAFKVGVDGEYYFSEMYAIKSGLGITFNQGGTLKFADLGTAGVPLFKDSQSGELFTGTQEAKFKYQYIEIPLGMKMRTNEIGYFRYFAEIPVFTFGLNTASRADIDGKDLKIGKDTGFFQFSWGLGGGLEYAVTETVTLTGGAYFQSGVINTYFAKSGVSDIDKSKTRVNAVEIRIGVLF